MSTVDVIRTMKQVHPNDVILIKIGKFYHAYGKDAYIISFIFNYQLKKVETNTNTTGFPAVALNKVIKTLEDKSINYMVIDRGDNYEPIDKGNFKQNNKYIDMYNTAHRYQTRKNKIDEIYEYLLTNINDDIVREQIQRIVIQNMFDKMVNHLVARFILLPAILPCLVDTNVASRANKGTSAGLEYYYDFRRICDVKFKEYYIL